MKLGVLFLSVFALSSLILFISCMENEINQPINIDGVLDSINREAGLLNISFKYNQEGKVDEISYYSQDGYFSHYLKMNYPDNSKIEVSYSSYLDGPEGKMIIFYSSNKIDSIHNFLSMELSCFPTQYSYYQYMDDRILQIDSTICTRGDPPYYYETETINWLLNSKEQIIKMIWDYGDGVIEHEYQYDEMVNPISHSFFQIVWHNRYPLINYRTIFPILQKNNIIRDEMEIGYNSDGMPVKIKQTIPPQYYLHYSY